MLCLASNCSGRKSRAYSVMIHHSNIHKSSNNIIAMSGIFEGKLLFLFCN